MDKCTLNLRMVAAVERLWRGAGDRRELVAKQERIVAAWWAWAERQPEGEWFARG